MENVKVGSDKWFELLNEKVKFPKMIAFHLSPNKDVYAVIVDTKAKNTDEIKLGKLTSMTTIFTDSALMGVKYVSSDMEYFEHYKHYANKWGVEL